MQNDFNEIYQQWSPEIKEYFDKLPPSIQETIKQSGTKIQTLDHLKDIAENYQGNF